MDPARPAFAIAFFVCACEPADFGRDAAAFGQSTCQVGAHTLGAADAVEEGGLEDAGDAEGGGGEEDAQGGRGADEEVL